MRARLCSLIAALLVWGALPGVGRAQTPGGPPAALSEPAADADEKRPLVALGLPILSTSLSVVFLFSGNEALAGTGAVLFVAGPSVGHLYAGESRNAMIHSGVRAVAAVATITGILHLLISPDCDSFDARCPMPLGTSLLIFGGFAVGTGSAIYSVVDAPFAARRHNREVRARQLFITPAPMVGPDHSTGLGLQLGGRF